MIGAALLIGGLIAGGTIIAAFWKEIQSWIKRVYEKLKTVVQGSLVGTRIFFSKIQDAGKEISKNYAKVGTKWQETVVQRTVEINEIPKEYLERMRNNDTEYEFTQEMMNEIQH